MDILNSIMSTIRVIAIYIRVSTSEQADLGYSLGEQERLGIEWCNRHGFTHWKVYADRGISGGKIKNRPGILELINDVQSNKVAKVVVWKTNRLARNLLNQLEIAREFEQNDVSLISLTESIDTSTPTGKMMLSMLGMIGEMERDTIAQNVAMGMKARARDGKWNGGKVLGYDLVDSGNLNKKGRPEKVLKINDAEAETVKLIFDLYKSGKGYKAIANEVNHSGHRTKKGNQFAISTIREILLNPVYHGYIRYNVRVNWNEKRRKNKNPDPIIVEGKHEAIIDDETWDIVQERLSNTLGKPSKVHNGTYPLTGILKCPSCGSGMVLSRTINTNKDGTKRRLDYYSCGSWKNKGSSVCKSNGIRVDKANEFVFKKINQLLNDDKLIQNVVNQINADRKAACSDATGKKAELEKTRKKINDELQKLSQKRDSAIGLFSEDLLDKATLSSMLESIKSNEEALIIKLNSLPADDESVVLPQVPFEDVKAIMQNFDQLFKTFVSMDDQKRLLQLLVEEITVNANKKIETITLNLNPYLKDLIKEEESLSAMEGLSSFSRSYRLDNVVFEI